MNEFTRFLCYAATGAFSGLVVAAFTLIVMYQLSRRSESFEPTYWSITIAESLLLRALLVLYPTTFAIFAVLLFILRR